MAKVPMTPREYMSKSEVAELLEENLYHLNEQLNIANERAISIIDVINKISSIQSDLQYHLQGMQIYSNDIMELINESK
tara:strand:+ start:2327 stop:2563 length:237 start_codon:yes stop_codon:yes gene_type:complete